MLDIRIGEVAQRIAECLDVRIDPSQPDEEVVVDDVARLCYCAEKIDRRELSITLPYAAYEPARRLIVASPWSRLDGLCFSGCWSRDPSSR